MKLEFKMIKFNAMRLSIFGLLAIVILAFTSCSKSESKIGDDNADAELIYAIQKATNKQAISINELPSPSRTVLSEDYADDYVDLAKLAPKLGYEVDMRCKKGPAVGEYRQTYFDLSGRELKAEMKGKGDHGGKGDKGDYGNKVRPCFELVYPVTFIMQDGTEISIDGKDDEEGWAEIKAWYQAHPDVKKRPTLEFPVDIVYKDGTTATINNEVEMKEAIADCKGDKGDKGDKKKCFELVLPVTYTLPDDSEITVENKEDYMLIKAWYAEHPDVMEKPEIQFPVDIKYKDGTVLTINSKEELMEAKKECKGNDHGDKRKCFELVLPVTYTMPNGDEITIEKKEDRLLIKAWYEEHQDYDAKPELQFPIDIKYKDGTVKTINSMEELMKAKKDCKGNDGGKKSCFHLVLPVTYTMPDGSEIIIEKKEDRLLIRQWYAEHPDVAEKPELQFPVEIKYKDGTVLTINSAEEMREAREDCKDKEDDDSDKD